jgi:hypothetical protein
MKGSKLSLPDSVFPELMRQMGNLVVEDIRQSLEENQQQDVVLELRGIERPRISHAASQSQLPRADTSSFLTRSCLSGSFA